MKTLKTVIISILLIGSSIAFAQPVAQGTFDNNTYIAVLATNGITWTAAEALAVAMGGHLASVTSQAENQFIYSLTTSDSSLWMPAGTQSGIGPWLGGYKQNNSWCWSDGTAFSYSNWSWGEPNNYGGIEAYIELYSGDTPMADFWNDAPNDTTGSPYHVGTPNPHGFVVEVVPEASAMNLFLLGLAFSVFYRFQRGATRAAGLGSK